MLPRQLLANYAGRIILAVSLTYGVHAGLAAEHADSALYGIGGDFKGFDPIDSGDVESANQVCRVYEGLLEYAYLDRPYRAIPRLAEALPEVSADGLTYTFKIKQGVRFQDDACFPGGKGRELTAEDFVYSFKRVLDPKLESQGDWIFINHVLGAQEWARAGDPRAPLPGFQSLDRSTLQFRLVKPYPQLLWVLTMPYAFAVPHEAVEYYGSNFRNHPVGTGPFRLKSWRRNYRIEYERNPTFSGQSYPDTGEPSDREAGLLEDADKPLPLLDRIVEYDVNEFYTAWQMFLGGQTYNSGINKDYFEKVITPQLGLSDSLKKKGIRLYKVPELATYYIGFNMLDPVVGQSPNPVENDRHRKLRQAIATAIDVEKYIAVITNGRYLAGNTPIPPGVLGHTDKPYSYKFDATQAKQLLAEAGYPDGRNAQGHPLRLTMIMPGAGSTDVRQQADFFTEEVHTLGIDFTVQQMTFTEYLRREHDGETQVFFAGWVIDYPDAQNFLQLFYGPNKAPGVNATNYQNPEFDRLYERILSMPESPERTALYEKMADMVNADCAWALIGYPLAYGLFQPWFQNYKPHAFPYANWKYYKMQPH
jgi:oligopeptide transport system substrate-binding protein